MRSPRSYHLLFLLCVAAAMTATSSAGAQGTSLLIARDHPLMSIGLYATDTDSRQMRQILVSGSFSPEPIMGALGFRDEYITRGAAFDFTGGMRYHNNDQKEIRWRFALLDADIRGLRSSDWNGLIGSSDLVVQRTRGAVRAGLTLAEYDRTTQAELDARWLEIRLGYGLDLPLWQSGGFILDGMAAAGAASFQPGAAGYPDLGAAGEQLIFGPETGGDVRAEFRQRITPWMMAALSFTARERSIFDFDGNELHRFIGAGELRLLVLLERHYSSRDEVVQLYMRGESERAHLGDGSQNLVVLRAGIHYLFNGQW